MSGIHGGGSSFQSDVACGGGGVSSFSSSSLAVWKMTHDIGLTLLPAPGRILQIGTGGKEGRSGVCLFHVQKSVDSGWKQETAFTLKKREWSIFPFFIFRNVPLPSEPSIAVVVWMEDLA